MARLLLIISQLTIGRPPHLRWIGGDTHGPGAQRFIDINFDGRTLASAKVVLGFYANDYDSTSGDEDAWGYITLQGSTQFFQNGGLQKVYNHSDDFEAYADVTISREP